MVCSFFFFFFQAEDGIRASSVTGVQTCALPISGAERLWRRLHDALRSQRAGARGRRALLPRAPGSPRALSAVSLARKALVPFACTGQRVDGERGEPVLARVAAARDVRQARLEMAQRGLPENCPLGKSARKAEIAPSAAEVQPIEMPELA